MARPARDRENVLSIGDDLLLAAARAGRRVVRPKGAKPICTDAWVGRKEIVVIVGPLKIKAQIFCGEEGAMGPGKADLLEAIHAHGSISAAGRAMQMSYRRTWLLVDAMNRCWTEKLVETTLGGGPSRGARLTPLGHRVLDEYRSLQRNIVAASAQRMDTLGALLRDRPLPAHASRSDSGGKGG